MSAERLEGAGSDRSRVRLLEVDPELGHGLNDADRKAAASLLVADTWSVTEAERWLPPSAEGAPGLLGLLVISGMALRRIASHAQQAVDVLGRGDILRPWDEIGYTSLPLHGSWQVVAPLTLAEINARHGSVLGRYPQLIGALLERSIRRARWLALQQHIATLPSIEHRVLMAFWHLAERWGEPDAGGTLLRLPLTHAQIGNLIGTRRVAAANALRRLERQDLIRRRAPGSWRLDEPVVLAFLSPGDAADRSRFPS